MIFKTTGGQGGIPSFDEGRTYKLTIVNLRGLPEASKRRCPLGGLR